MTVGQFTSSDPIIQKVIDATRPHANHKYKKQAPIKLGRGRFFVVTFVGEDNYGRTHFVYEKGTHREVYVDLRQLIVEHGRGIWGDEKLIVGLALTIGWAVLICALVFLGVNDKIGQGFQALSALASTITGYLIAVVSGRGQGQTTTPDG